MSTRSLPLPMPSEAMPSEARPRRLPSIGSRVAGRYRVVALLQKGGLARSCVAVDEGPAGAPRLVVLESLRSQRASSVALETFVACAHLRERMSHPNVIQTYGLVQHDGMPLIVAEYLEGETLGTLLALAYGTPEFSLELRL